MTHPVALLIIHTVLLFVLFSALGSAPALLLRERGTQLLASPVIGFAVAACFLTTSALFLPLDIAAWVVLIPAAIVSLATTAVLRHHRLATSARDYWLPFTAAVVGAAMALVPAVMHKTQGPFSLVIYDAWGYAASSLWLQHHAATSALGGAGHLDLTLAFGRLLGASNARIGVDSVVAGTASLFRVDTAAMIAPLLAVLFALVPLTLWLVARALGASRYGAGAAAILGLTPALLSMVEDTALGNLGGIVLVPVALLFVIRAEKGRRLVEVVLAGLLVGALLAVYPEFFPPFALVVVINTVVLVFARGLLNDIARPFRHVLGRLGLVALAALVAAPYACYRAFYYLRFVARPAGWDAGLPPRYLSVADVGSWAFGLLHIYELQYFASLSPVRLAFDISFPIILAAVAAVGLYHGGPQVLAFVLAPIGVAIGAGLYAYRSYEGHHCQYCLWKSLTEMLPFLLVGVALGLDRLGISRVGRRREFLASLPALGVAAVALAVVGHSDAKLIRMTDAQAAFFPEQLRAIGTTVKQLPVGSTILIEGTSTMPRPPFMLPAAYYALQGRHVVVAFDAVQPAPAYLGVGADTRRFYTPAYDYVLTPFTDVRSDRDVIGQYGPFVLERRATVDAVVSATNWALAYRGPRQPSFAKPFDLRLSSPRPGPAALTLTLGTRAQGGTLAFASRGRQLSTWSSQNGAMVCAEVRLRKGATVVRATPIAPLGVIPLGQLGLVSIRGVHAELGRRCDEPAAEPLVFGAGWYPTEVGPDQKPFRWMGGVASIQLGTARSGRPARRFQADLTSFQVPRRVEIRLGKRLLAKLQIPTGKTARLEVTVPAGRGRGVLTLEAYPPPLPASAVSPADPRLLSLALSDASVGVCPPAQARGAFMSRPWARFQAGWSDATPCPRIASTDPARTQAAQTLAQVDAVFEEAAGFGDEAAR